MELSKRVGRYVVDEVTEQMLKQITKNCGELFRVVAKKGRSKCCAESLDCVHPQNWTRRLANRSVVLLHAFVGIGNLLWPSKKRRSKELQRQYSSNEARLSQIVEVKMVVEKPGTGS